VGVQRPLGWAVMESCTATAAMLEMLHTEHHQTTRFNPRPPHVGFLVDKWQWGRSSSKYFGFPHQYHSTNAPWSSPVLYNLRTWQHRLKTCF